MYIGLFPLFLRRLLIALVFGLISLSSLADDVDKGITAYQQQDYQTAFYAWSLAAQQGDPDAEYHLGQLYRLGQGVNIDYPSAQSYYLKAAKKGHPLAQLNLGTLYYSGKAIEKQEEDAFYWLHQAAEKGDAHAQWMIGDMLLNGQGVAQDSVAAYSWLTLASEQFHLQASIKQTQLKSTLGAEQLSLADHLTRAFKHKKTTKTKTLPPAEKTLARQSQPSNGTQYRVQIGSKTGNYRTNRDQ